MQKCRWLLVVNFTLKIATSCLKKWLINIYKAQYKYFKSGIFYVKNWSWTFKIYTPIDPLVFYLPQTFNSFGFQIFLFWAYLVKVVSETHVINPGFRGDRDAQSYAVCVVFCDHCLFVLFFLLGIALYDYKIARFISVPFSNKINWSIFAIARNDVYMYNICQKKTLWTDMFKITFYIFLQSNPICN
jgi:hypothetical protein